MSNTSTETGVRIFGNSDTGYSLIGLRSPELAPHAVALIIQCLKRFGDRSTSVVSLGPSYLTAQPPIPADRVGAVATALCQGGFGEVQIQREVGFATVAAEPVPQMQPGYVDLDFPEDDGTGE